MYTLNRLLIGHMAFTQMFTSMANLESLFNLISISWDCGRKPEYLERTHSHREDVPIWTRDFFLCNSFLSRLYNDWSNVECVHAHTQTLALLPSFGIATSWPLFLPHKYLKDIICTCLNTHPWCQSVCFPISAAKNGLLWRVWQMPSCIKMRTSCVWRRVGGCKAQQDPNQLPPGAGASAGGPSLKEHWGNLMPHRPGEQKVGWSNSAYRRPCFHGWW